VIPKGREKGCLAAERRKTIRDKLRRERKRKLSRADAR